MQDFLLSNTKAWTSHRLSLGNMQAIAGKEKLGQFPAIAGKIPCYNRDLRWANISMLKLVMLVAAKILQNTKSNESEIFLIFYDNVKCISSLILHPSLINHHRPITHHPLSLTPSLKYTIPSL